MQGSGLCPAPHPEPHGAQDKSCTLRGARRGAGLALPLKGLYRNFLFVIASDRRERGNLLFYRGLVRLLRSFHSLAMTVTTRSRKGRESSRATRDSSPFALRRRLAPRARGRSGGGWGICRSGIILTASLSIAPSGGRARVGEYFFV
jgi:hypothetical protein